ncbi:MAG: hypothetical protein R3D67_09530 [Hyphomicrobiaceae bacterium]
MSKRSVFMSLVHCGLAALFVAAAMPVGAHDAEARRLRLGPKAMALPAARAARAFDNEDSNADANAAAGAEVINAAPGQARGRPLKSARDANAAAKVPVVPGCQAGMMCTVCLAGCVAGPQSIVSSAPAPVEPEPVKAQPVAASVPTTPWSADGAKSRQDGAMPVVKAKVPAPVTTPHVDAKPMQEAAKPAVSVPKPAAKMEAPVVPTAVAPHVLPPLANEAVPDKVPATTPAVKPVDKAPATSGPDIMNAAPVQGQ